MLVILEFMLTFETESTAHDVEIALTNCKNKVYENIDTGNGSVTYSFRLEITDIKECKES